MHLLNIQERKTDLLNTMADYDNIITIKFTLTEQPKFTEGKAHSLISNLALRTITLIFYWYSYNESLNMVLLLKANQTTYTAKGLLISRFRQIQQDGLINSVAKKCILDDEIFGELFAGNL